MAYYRPSIEQPLSNPFPIFDMMQYTLLLILKEVQIIVKEAK